MLSVRSALSSYVEAQELIFALRNSFFVLRSSFSCSGAHARVQELIVHAPELMFVLGSSFFVLRSLPGGSGGSHGANGGRAGYLGAHVLAPELIVVLMSSVCVCSGAHCRAQELIFVLRNTFFVLRRSCSGGSHGAWHSSAECPPRTPHPATTSQKEPLTEHRTTH